MNKAVRPSWRAEPKAIRQLILPIHFAEDRTPQLIENHEWQGWPGMGGGTFDTDNPAGQMVEIDGVLYCVSSEMYTAYNNVRFNKSTDGGHSWPAPVQAGYRHLYPWIWYSISENGNVFKINGSIYIASFADKYRWIAESSLPWTQ